jgi:hypothetical protein
VKIRHPFRVKVNGACYAAVYHLSTLRDVAKRIAIERRPERIVGIYEGDELMMSVYDKWTTWYQH